MPCILNFTVSETVSIDMDDYRYARVLLAIKEMKEQFDGNDSKNYMRVVRIDHFLRDVVHELRDKEKSDMHIELNKED